MSDRRTTPNTDLPAASAYASLRGGMRVERELVDAVGFQVASVLHDLTPGTRYTARQLCGFPLWGYFSRAERRLAGRCLAHLVATGRVDLAFAQEKPAYPLRYVRRAQAA